MAMKDKTTQQETDVLIVTVESLEAELLRVKSENNNRMKEVRDLAQEEISQKDSQIGELEDADKIGSSLAEALLDNGADAILKDYLK